MVCDLDVLVIWRENMLSLYPTVHKANVPMPNLTVRLRGCVAMLQKRRQTVVAD